MEKPTEISHFESFLSEKLNKSVKISRFSPVSGGDINQARKLITSVGVFFVKSNDASSYPLMFEKEATGLAHLSNNTSFTIPKVIGVSYFQNNAHLFMCFIEKGVKKDRFWSDFGQKLAQMHQKTQNYYGFEEDNYIGSLVQSNTKHSNWVEFLILERLEKQFKLARESKHFDTSDTKNFHQLFRKLENLYPQEPPSLLHGDLWGGNYMMDGHGNPCLIDPAVYYGNREMDIAMTQLFGGFDAIMYRSYNETYPLEKDWKSRIPLSQLYPLLVHVNLFGGSYVDSVRGVVKKYV